MMVQGREGGWVVVMVGFLVFWCFVDSVLGYTVVGICMKFVRLWNVKRCELG